VHDQGLISTKMYMSH